MRIVVTVLCGVGLYVSLFMLRKSRRAERGLLQEASVVETPRARLLGGIPNAAFGIAYYLLLGSAIWFVHQPWQAVLLLIASALAAAMSLILAYSLLYVTRMPCPYCWTSHAANALLLLCMISIFIKRSY